MAPRARGGLAVRGTTVGGVTARRVWTLDGSPALEVEIELACGVRGRAMACPAFGAWRSFGARAAVGPHCMPPSAAARAIHTVFAAALRGLDASAQGEIDDALSELKLGDDPWVTRAARSACSIAAAQAAARAAGVPLYRYVRPGEPARMPMPMVEVAAAAAPASPFRALAVVPFAADGMDEALAISIALRRVLAETFGTGSTLIDERAIESVLRAIEQMGFIPAEEIGIALDVGAARIYRAGRYACADGMLDSDGWGERLLRVVDAYPLSAIEDPLADAARLAQLVPLVDHRVRVVGDDLFASDPERIAAAVADGSAAAATLRPEAAGSLSGLRAAFDAARLAAWPVLAAAAVSGEDTSLVHLATAWQASYIKLGGVGRGFADANELLRIEAMLRRAPSAQRVEAAARLVH